MIPIAAVALAAVVWGAAGWLAVAVPITLALLALLAWGYTRANVATGVRLVAAGLKVIGIVILAMCLLEPLFSSTRARPGANLFIILADNSQSMTLHDRDTKPTRAEQLKSLTPKESKWLTRIGQDFDLRQYAFDSQLHSGVDLQAMTFDGHASNLADALQRLERQYQGRPLAGILLLTDGSATDAAAISPLIESGNTRLPPIYPVALGGEKSADDISLQQIAVSQTSFEDAPVTLAAQISTSGYAGKTLVAELMDDKGNSIERQKVVVDRDDEPATVRFRLRPEAAGVSFFKVRVAAEGQLDQLDNGTSAEATVANNSRLVAVDRGKGPYRILYVCGRPNWEFKFMERALVSDDQVQLVGLIRVAKREPKFNYINAGDRANPLYRGFNGNDPEQAEQYDQPVLKRVGVADETELRGGFPKSAEELYRYHAIIIGDLESEFFTQDQMLLIKEFVRQRGGGLLMLGGQESFKEGKYDRTPIGDLLPVYVDNAAPPAVDAKFRLLLTREGWLEPWVRLRSEEPAERSRLSGMPPFMTLNGVRGIKPGATVLANVAVEGTEQVVPALVEQRFGRGRAAALMIGDMWRWELSRSPEQADDLPKAWRQMIRWLVSDVPQRVELSITPRHGADDAEGSLSLSVHVRDASYGPQDNAGVTVKVTTPDGKTVDLPAESSGNEAGLYEAVFVPRQSGAYRATVKAAAPDGSEIAQIQAGWTSDPAADEFRELRPNRELLQRIAEKTGGAMVKPEELDGFAQSLPTRHADITEPYIRPIWHQSWVFLIAIACLCGEWGLRRWKGLP